VGGTSSHVHKFMPIFNPAVTAYNTFFSNNWDPPLIGTVDAEAARVVAALFNSPCTARMAICMVHLAASEGQDGCLRELHKLGVSLAVADSDGDTPAHSAVNHGQEECLRVLHELGASIATANSDGETPAHLAASEGQEGCLRVLHELGVSLAVTDSDGDTPAHLAARRISRSIRGQEGCLRELHKLGVSLDVANSDGNTPVHSAASQARRSVCGCCMSWVPALPLQIQMVKHRRTWPPARATGAVCECCTS
jgi:ankyrin repeat protein